MLCKSYRSIITLVFPKITTFVIPVHHILHALMVLTTLYYVLEEELIQFDQYILYMEKGTDIVCPVLTCCERGTDIVCPVLTCCGKGTDTVCP